MTLVSIIYFESEDIFLINNALGKLESKFIVALLTISSITFLLATKLAFSSISLKLPLYTIPFPPISLYLASSFLTADIPVVLISE